MAKARTVPSSDRACAVEGCERKHNAHGLCGMHGWRLARHGDVHNPGRLVRSSTGLCSVGGCDKEHVAKGLCGMHYQRSKRGGGLDIAEVLVCARCGMNFPRPHKGNPRSIRFCSHECRYAQQLDDHRENSAERYIYLLKWRKNNPDLFKASLLKRSAAKRTKESSLVTGKDLGRLVLRFRGLCAYCAERPHAHFDHVIPLARGGRHAIGNLMPSCATCNLSKGSKLLAEWRLTRPLPRRFRRRTGARMLTDVS